MGPAARIAGGFCGVPARQITAGIWVNDEESGLKQDLVEWLDRLAPPGDYRPHLTGEDNADAHLKRTPIHHPTVPPGTRGEPHPGPGGQGFFGEVGGGREERGGGEGTGGGGGG